MKPLLFDYCGVLNQKKKKDWFALHNTSRMWKRLDPLFNIQSNIILMCIAIQRKV